jgi:hypothetical protein
VASTFVNRSHRGGVQRDFVAVAEVGQALDAGRHYS